MPGRNCAPVLISIFSLRRDHQDQRRALEAGGHRRKDAQRADADPLLGEDGGHLSLNDRLGGRRQAGQALPGGGQHAVQHGQAGALGGIRGRRGCG